jgi:hypothetical protein
MKQLKLLSLLPTLLLSGCAHYNIGLHDLSTDTTYTADKTNTTTRTITTDIKGTAWFSSAQNINKLKGVQTDKTQSFGSDGIGQQGATNVVEGIKGLAELVKQLKMP